MDLRLRMAAGFSYFISSALAVPVIAVAGILVEIDHLQPFQNERVAAFHIIGYEIQFIHDSLLLLLTSVV